MELYYNMPNNKAVRSSESSLDTLKTEPTIAVKSILTSRYKSLYQDYLDIFFE